MATIRNRGPHQWQAIVKRRGIGTASKTFDTRRDAEAWATVTEADMIRGHYIRRDDAEKTTLAELIARYRADVLPQKRGKHFATALRLLEFFDGMEIAAITGHKTLQMLKRYTHLHAERLALKLG